MTKIAIPHWRERISPVFDVAANVLIVELDGCVESARGSVILDCDEPQSRVARLAELGIDVLVCGAISRPLRTAVQAAGIKVIPHTCGEVDRVLAGFIDGRLNQDDFRMPGCFERRRRVRGRRRGQG